MTVSSLTQLLSELLLRLGNIAVQKFKLAKAGGFSETIQWAATFGFRWKLPDSSRD